jgi:hypothetical protein
MDKRWNPSVQSMTNYQWHFLSLLGLLKMRIIKYKLMKASHIKFEWWHRNCVWNICKSPFMTLGKSGFIMDQYGCKS